MMLDIRPEMFGAGDVTRIVVYWAKDYYIADFWDDTQLIMGTGDTPQQAVDDCIAAYQEWLAITGRSYL